MSPGNEHGLGCGLGHLFGIVALPSQHNPPFFDRQGLQDLVRIHQAQRDPGMVGVAEKKIYPIGIEISHNDLAQGRPHTRGDLGDIREQLIGLAIELFSKPQNLLTEWMLHDDATGELLMPEDRPAVHDRLHVRISAQHPLHGMGEGGVAQVVKQPGKAHLSNIFGRKAEVLGHAAGHVHAA